MEINKNIPIPKRRFSRAEFLKTLNIGDSFCVHDVQERAAYVSCSFPLKIKLLTRKQKDDMSIRIWRVG
jgi:hypothetical protein